MPGPNDKYRIPPPGSGGEKPDKETNKAATELGGGGGLLGRVLGTGDSTRIALAAILAVIIIIAYVAFVAWFPTEVRIDSALDLLEKALLILLGVFVGSAVSRKD